MDKYCIFDKRCGRNSFTTPAHETFPKLEEAVDAAIDLLKEGPEGSITVGRVVLIRGEAYLDTGKPSAQLTLEGDWDDLKDQN